MTSSVPAPWSAAVGVAFGALYLYFAPPILGPHDSSELTLALAFAGPAHPTGYPLYVLFGHLFGLSLHAAGVSWAHAANAWSAVGGAVAMGFAHALGVRVIAPDAPVGRVGRAALGLAATAVIGLHPVWLLDAMFAEVYSWHLAWVCAASLFALGWIRRLASAPGAAARPGAATAFAAGVLAALGVTHHATAVVPLAVLGAALVLAMARARVLRVSLAPPFVAGVLIGGAGVLFTAWRAFHPAEFQWPVLDATWASVGRHLSAAEYQDLAGHFAPDAVQSQLLGAYVYPVLVPLLLGLAWALVRARGAAERTCVGALLAIGVAQVGFAFYYGVSDPTSYFEPALLMGALALPLIGAEWLPRRSLTATATAVAAIALVALGAWWLPAARGFRIGTEVTERQVRALWHVVPAGEGIVFWSHVMAFRLEGYALLDRDRPDLYAADPGALTWAPARRAFERRFGLDPLAGLVPMTAAKVASIAENVSRQTRLPVYVLDLGRNAVYPVPKGTEGQ